MNVGAAESQPDAPAYALNFYNVYAGLPHNSAQVLAQTRDGYLWVGTESGLARFDGVRFVTFRTANTPELPSNFIRHLFEDRDGWLWIGTQNGLCRYRDGKFERRGLIGSPVAGIAADRAGHIWLATQGNGLVEHRDGEFISHLGDAGMPAEKDIRSVFVDSSDRLWFAIRGKGALCLENNRVTQFDAGSFPFLDFARIVESPRGTLWIGTDTEGILRVRDGQLRHYGREDGLGPEVLRNIFADQRGQIWAILDKALYVLSGPDGKKFTPAPTPGIEYPRNLIQDHEGSYWVATAGDGIVHLRPSGFRMATAEDGLLGGNSRTVAVDRAGDTWVGLPNTGLVRIAPDGSTTVLDLGAGAAGEVWSILPARDGTVWIGTRDRLIAWREGRQETFPQFQRCRALFEAHDGTIWIGSENAGVTRCRDGVFTSMVDALRARQAVPTTGILTAMAFAESADNTLYIGLRENGGLAILKDGKIVVHQRPETTEIRAIHPDAAGDLWLGTKGRGLTLVSGDQWLNPETFAESFNDHVSAIVADDEGRFWLGTPKGLVWVKREHLLSVAHGRESDLNFRLALANDGVRPAIVGAGSFPDSAKAPDGTLRFVTKRGLVVVNPREIAFNAIAPPVAIEQAIADNHAIDPQPELRLAAGTHALTIDYTALSFVAPSQVHFRYRLEGHDSNWTDAGPRRTAFYTTLEPGSYRFHVVAGNEDDVWNLKGASVAVIQLPFFYQTRWFYALLALGLLGAGFGVFRWRTAALQNRNVELERHIVERTAELAKSYEAIRASEYFYHSLVESLPQMIVRKNPAGRITYANSAFAEMFGRAPGDVVGRTEHELYPPALAEKYRANDERAMARRETIEFETIADTPQGRRFLHVKQVPLFERDGRAIGVQMLFWDMTTFREIEDKLKHAQHQLVETSRLAGIAEMATGILHNLGNALNSVNTTSNTLAERIRHSKVSSVAKTAQLLAAHNDRLAEFFATDTRGRQLPGYLKLLGEHLATERDDILHELEALQKNVDHIKELVATQQSHARVGGVKETLPASELVEYSLRLNEASLQRHTIAVVREFEAAPPITVERQKALQIVNNLLHNARDAIDARPGGGERKITLAVRSAAAGRVQIVVSDTGVGIARENLTRIFAFGFTTKKDGHGFGLHSSALAAREMGGSLHAASDGPGAGATFVLELPVDGDPAPPAS
ncbi:MAG TPA: two-component regulator propeller domain-containing protein [Opitutaceae bacterium]|nr:two-component regulator propeller domain-containing protein [Opitutaceae bacterium]